MNNSFIEINNLSYSENGNIIVNDFSWKLNEPMFVTFLMPYKSNNIFEKVLCGITKQDSGDIIIDNVDIKMMDYKTKSIYMIFKGGARSCSFFL